MGKKSLLRSVENRLRGKSKTHETLPRIIYTRILSLKLITLYYEATLHIMSRFSPEILSPLVKLLRQAGHNWNPAAIPPVEVPFSVAKVAGFTLREYEEPTVAEFGVRGLLDSKRKAISAQYQKNLSVKSKALMASHENTFENEMETVSFLLGNMEIVSKVYEKTPLVLIDFEIAIQEMQESIAAYAAELQGLDDICLCYFLSSRATSDSPWTVDMLGGLGRGARKKLEEFMNTEVVKTGEEEEETSEAAPDLGE